MVENLKLYDRQSKPSRKQEVKTQVYTMTISEETQPSPEMNAPIPGYKYQYYSDDSRSMCSISQQPLSVRAELLRISRTKHHLALHVRNKECASSKAVRAPALLAPLYASNFVPFSFARSYAIL